MALKGIIPKDIIAANKFTLAADNDEILITAITGAEETIETVELPDKTSASAGRTEMSEVTIKIPAHVDESVNFMNIWFQACKDPVQPGAYKTCVVTAESSSGGTVRTYTYVGVFLKGRKTPDHALEDGATMTEIEYTASIDEVFHS
jgi:hypothetical protein